MSYVNFGFMVHTNGQWRKPQILVAKCLSDSYVITNCKQKLSHELWTPMRSNVGQHRDQIKRAMDLLAGFLCGPKSDLHKKCNFQ